jgi:dihydroorotate dehydrogenase
MSRAEFAEDFATLAEAVVAAGAQVVELNLSCPNVAAREGELYLDTDLAADIAAVVRGRIGRRVPLLVKIGAIEDDARMAALLGRLAPQVDGVVMINAPSRELLDASGEPAFGPGRRTAGMMGGATFDIGLACVRRAVAAARSCAPGLRILAVGGVTTPERIAAYFDAGAYAVLGASALAWDPYLAIRTKQRHPGF